MLKRRRRKILSEMADLLVIFIFGEGAQGEAEGRVVSTYSQSGKIIIPTPQS